LKTLYAQNGDGDFVTDVYAFADFAGEYQHNLFLDGLLKRLYQEAGVSLWVMVLPSASKCVCQYDALGTLLIPQVHLLVIGLGSPEAKRHANVACFWQQIPVAIGYNPDSRIRGGAYCTLLSHLLQRTRAKRR
jgi:hypothetical protein